MKKVLIVIFLLLMVSVGIIFYPRSMEHGIVIAQNQKQITLLINGETKSYKSTANFPRLTVVDFKYNLLKAYAFKELSPITDRVMIKEDSSYDLETLGRVPVSSDAFYYSIDKSNIISPSDKKSVIVGKTNLKYYKNKEGKLKTFLVFPMDYSSMRVGISTTDFSSVYHDKVQIKVDAPAKLYSLRDNVSVELPKGSVLNFEREGNSIKYTANNKATTFTNRLYIKGDALSVQSIKRGSEQFTPSYSGVLEFNVLDKGMYIVNEVDLEDYLRKVVPSEMPSSGGVEALKCQAIAARTYAISDMIINRFANLGFYVDDSTRSQVYNNIPMQPISTEAVNATKGLIMTYEGIPIDAKYYSTSAGTGVDYKDVWFNADGSTDYRPYIANNNYLIPAKELPKSEQQWLNFYKDTSIKAIDSDYPYFRWKVEYSTEGITTALNKSLLNIAKGQTSRNYLSIYVNSTETKDLPILKDLQDIKILKRGTNGIAIEVSFVFSNATVNVRSDSYIRSALKYGKDYTNEATSLVRHKGTALTASSSLPSAFFAPEKKDGKFILYGGGYGHGAGMSQYGAIELSKKGMKFNDILNTFYKDVIIESIYK